MMVAMKSKSEVEKVSRGKTAIIEGYVIDYAPNSVLGLVLKDGVCISGDDPDETVEALEGERALDADSLKEMIDAFNHGRGSQRYYKMRWKFSGKVVRKVGGSSYLVDVADVGTVKVSLGGGEKQPKADDVINFIGVAGRLETLEGKPLLEFHR
jgi:hypothetical protein